MPHFMNHYYFSKLFLIILTLTFFTACGSDPSTDAPSSPQSPQLTLPEQPTDQLFKKYFEAYPNEVQTVQPNVASQTIEEEAFRMYEQKRYEQAALLFQEILRKGINYDVYFYRGNTFLIMGYIEDARGEFTRILKDHPFYHQSRWYIALTYLKEQRTKETRLVLQGIVDQPTAVYKQQEAKALLEELSKILKPYTFSYQKSSLKTWKEAIKKRVFLDFTIFIENP